jgi:tRNA(fMet)-specific endonuclease VapC
MTQYILDSDHLSLHQRGHESLKARLFVIPPKQISITIITAEELIRGRLAQVRRAITSDDRIKAYHWLSVTLDYLFNFNILKYTFQAESYFRTLLERKIRIGSQDLKIAAIALSQNAVLVTRNLRHFEQISSLKLEDWSA